jgi:hypothetical protein
MPDLHQATPIESTLMEKGKVASMRLGQAGLRMIAKRRLSVWLARSWSLFTSATLRRGIIEQPNRQGNRSPFLAESGR